MTVLVLLMVMGYILFAVFVGKVIALGDLDLSVGESADVAGTRKDRARS
jgi:hypothetical protein